MRVWPLIVLFTLGFFTISCGEEKDNRTVLNSQAPAKQSQVSLPNPSGDAFSLGIDNSLRIDVKRFSTAIASRIVSVSKVDKVSISKKVDRNAFGGVEFTTSFRVTTTTGDTYDDFECLSTYVGQPLKLSDGIMFTTLVLKYCKSIAVDGARFGSEMIHIPLSEISLNGNKRATLQ